ncbi:unnamed protein product, partial [Rotaria magnacalcarata]
IEIFLRVYTIFTDRNRKPALEKVAMMLIFEKRLFA